MQTISKILGHNYEPLNTVEVILSNLKFNYEYLSSLDKNLKIAPVLKSNAYGHGISQIAKYVDKLNAPFLCVDSLYEAYELLKQNVKSPILIMGYINPISLRTKKLKFSFAVYNKEEINALNKYQPGAKIHIFIDTGMHREGISIDDLPKFIREIKLETNLEIEGVMSHLATSDKPNHELTKEQIKVFWEAVDVLRNMGIKPKWTHLGNSMAVLNHEKYSGKLGNLARTGVAFYGIDPEDRNKDLKPALNLISQVAQIKKVLEGQAIGYDFTYIAPRNMKIAILPIGYNDGVDRRLSNKGVVSINNQFCEIIGRVSMNITTVDVTNLKKVRVGDKVVIYSSKSNDKNSFENQAKKCETIPYDLLVDLNPSTRRVVL